MKPYSSFKNSPSRRRRLRGASIVELSIVSVLLLIISIAMSTVLTNAVNFYHSTNATLDAQQGVLFGINRISQELAESHRETVHLSSPPNSGLIFASPRDEAGNYQFDTFGRLQWQKFVCYYLGEVGEGDRTIPALLRKSVSLNDLGSAPSVSPPNPNLSPFSLTIADFNQAPPGQVVGRYVSAMEVKQAREVIEEDDLAEVFGSRVLQIKLTATTNYRNKFSVESETSVVLRN